MTQPYRLPLDRMPVGLVGALEAAGLEPRAVHALVVAALVEDLPGDDVTSWSTIPEDARCTGDVVARGDGVVAGLDVAEMVWRHVAGDHVRVERPVAEGGEVRRGDVVLTVHGPTALLLTAERTALNLACHLSGVATATRNWVRALEGTRARVRDTRKTLPGLRQLDKYAVRCGGGVNHRETLSDQALVKDNHVVACGGVVPAYRAVRDRYPDVPVQVEVTDVGQLRDLVEAGCREILLDNMDTATLAEAVAAAAGRARLEASGGLTLARAREVAEAGVDFLAVGGLTHSVAVLDLALDLRPSTPAASAAPQGGEA